jgi:transposase
MSRFDLSDAEWAIIASLLPGGDPQLRPLDQHRAIRLQVDALAMHGPQHDLARRLAGGAGGRIVRANDERGGEPHAWVSRLDVLGELLDLARGRARSAGGR